MRRKLPVFAVAFITVVIALSLSLQENSARSFHTPLEQSFLKRIYDEPVRNPIDSDQYFLGSVRCKGCHGFDTLHQSNIDANGVDVNLYDDWESSMMANSAIDPLWRAKVSHEILVDAGHSTELQTKCTSCHAPMGHFTAIYHGASSYTLSDLENDTLGLNGVACGGCHEIGTHDLGSVFSGDIPYDTSKVEFGPFENPLLGPMQLYVGLTPAFSEHMNTSQLCSSCHTLITNTVDLNGNYNGHTFTEQATYHEWLNSALAQDNITCQHCHMPQLTDSIVIANNILALAPRAPFNQHQFVGGNYFMVNMIKDNKLKLGAQAPDEDFDSTLAETYRMLTQQALGVHLYLDSLTADTAFLRFQITNKAGHKFPSGYPSRRAVVQLIVLDSNGDTVFQSGTFDGNHEVKNIDPVFEPHYNVINQSSQAQIYEMIMGDVNGDVTTVLERGDHVLKDNRIPPEGFVSTFPSYDTIKIVGDAFNDPDFNIVNGNEGSGKDMVHYHIPLGDATGSVSAYAKVYYQSVPPRWVQHMFTFSSAAIDSFKNMFDDADQSPIITAHDSLLNISVPLAASFIGGDHLLSLVHSLTNDQVTIYNGGQLMIYEIRVFKNDGKVCSVISINNQREMISVPLPEESGIYYLNIKTNKGVTVLKALKGF